MSQYPNPFLKAKDTLSLLWEVCWILPRVSHTISFANAGINIHISCIFELRIAADCAFPSATVATLAPGYNTHLSIRDITAKKDLEKPRLNTA